MAWATGVKIYPRNKWGVIGNPITGDFGHTLWDG